MKNLILAMIVMAGFPFIANAEEDLDKICKDTVNRVASRYLYENVYNQDEKHEAIQSWSQTSAGLPPNTKYEYTVGNDDLNYGSTTMTYELNFPRDPVEGLAGKKFQVRLVLGGGQCYATHARVVEMIDTTPITTCEKADDTADATKIFPHHTSGR